MMQHPDGTQHSIHSELEDGKAVVVGPKGAVVEGRLRGRTGDKEVTNEIPRTQIEKGKKPRDFPFAKDSAQAFDASDILNEETCTGLVILGDLSTSMWAPAREGAGGRR